MNTKKLAVVTGALKGLGFETARELASRRGMRVIITGRDEGRGQEALAKLKDAGAVSFMKLDVSDAADVDRFSKLVLKEHSSLDVLVNNAGIYLDRETGNSLTALSEMMQTTFRTNAVGAYLLARAFLPSMVTNGYGRIVNVSSGMGGLTDMEGGSPGYRMSKASMNVATKILAVEIPAKSGVLINSVCPGWVRTDMGGAGATRTLGEGIFGIVWAATLPADGPTGGFFRDGKPIPF